MIATLKAAYGIPEIAELAGLDRDVVGRMLIKAGIPFRQFEPGGKRWVMLVNLRLGLPDLWDSILLRNQIAEGVPVVCDMCGTIVEAETSRASAAI